MTGVIYARYSSDGQREESIEGQLRECYAYAEKNGIAIIDEYIDRALSAKTDKRPRFQQMIKDSAKQKFDTVLVWKLDRFARNRFDSASYKYQLRRNGVTVVSATEVISAGSEGILLESVLEGMAEYYSVELAEKVTRGLTENALKCKFNGGTVPIGYVINKDQHFKIDPLELRLIKFFLNFKMGLQSNALIVTALLSALRLTEVNPSRLSNNNFLLFLASSFAILQYYCTLRLRHLKKLFICQVEEFLRSPFF